MRALPNLDDEAAMLKRGRLSVIISARKEAAETLRDAHTFMQSNDWADWATHARVARDAADRLITLAAMWEEVKE